MARHMPLGSPQAEHINTQLCKCMCTHPGMHMGMDSSMGMCPTSLMVKAGANHSLYCSAISIVLLTGHFLVLKGVSHRSTLSCQIKLLDNQSILRNVEFWALIWIWHQTASWSWGSISFNTNIFINRGVNALCSLNGIANLSIWKCGTAIAFILFLVPANTTSLFGCCGSLCMYVHENSRFPK